MSALKPHIAPDKYKKLQLKDKLPYFSRKMFVVGTS